MKKQYLKTGLIAWIIICILGTLIGLYMFATPRAFYTFLLTGIAMSAALATMVLMCIYDVEK